MNYLALGISLVGLLFTIAGIAIYFSKIMKNKVPVMPVGLIISLALGILFAAVALFKVIPGNFIHAIPIALNE